MKPIVVSALLLAAHAYAGESKFAEEFGKRWTRTRQLAVGVAAAMPPVQYAFRPDPGSMSFAEQIAHVAQTNYAFCAGLKDTASPPAPLGHRQRCSYKISGRLLRLLLRCDRDCNR